MVRLQFRRALRGSYFSYGTSGVVKMPVRTTTVYSNFVMPLVDKVLIYNKQTAYESHRRKGTDLTKASYNLEKLQHAHNIHKEYLRKVYRALIDAGIRQPNIMQISTREEGINILRKKSIALHSKSAPKTFLPDLVIAVGGDGTFLRASHLLHPKLNTTHLPIVGINSNPDFSEGRLCLRAHKNVESTIAEIISGSNVKVVRRRRIKVTMTSDERQNFNTNDYYSDLPLDLDAIQRPENRTGNDLIVQDLPIIALNDVFVGERASSMVSHLDIKYKYYSSQQDWEAHPPQKNSGLVCCTGTGSTGWSKSINRICSETARLIACRLEYKDIKSTDWDDFADDINSVRTVFDPEHDHMGVSFREPIYNKISTGTFTNFIKVSNAQITSKLFHGMISIDGSTYYSLPAGCIINLEINKAWAINCVTLNDMHNK